MSIESPEELEHLKAAGRVVAAAIRVMRARARPGVTTLELDAVGERVFTNAGARSGPKLDYGFPGTTCISINDEAVHGIPSRRRLRKGDLVKLDAASRTALNRALAIPSAGVPINHIGATIQASVEADGYSVCPDLMGHGIGRRIHEAPNIPSYDALGFDRPLTTGLVITIEPIIAAGHGTVTEADDGWTITTRDHSLSAHSEHTIVITAGAPLILTA